MSVRIRADRVRLEYRIRRGLVERVTGGFAGATPMNRAVVAGLDDVTFALDAGDRLALVGRNGAGKTTLLKVLAGIYEPTSGRIEMEGRVDALLSVNLGFRREATGRRNIVLRGLINGWTRRDIAARMADIIDFSELGAFIDLPLKTYSQGMAARLAFSIATSFRPEILLMDEWIGAGDSAFQDKAKKRMMDFTREAGILVFASHDNELLAKTTNKVLELRQGKATVFNNMESYLAATGPDQAAPHRQGSAA